MWINSPMGKWDQDALVEKALREAEQRRLLEIGRGARGKNRTGELRALLFCAWAGLRPPFIEPWIPRWR
jgi:hypothetical protein